MQQVAEKYMREALREAARAKEDGEVPVGAVIVMGGRIISRGRNRVEKNQRATAHAEIEAINKACAKLKSWRLEGAELYVTLEPCAMCAGAIAGARIKKVYFGAYEHKSGCAVSLYPVLTENGLNHNAEYQGGVLKKECAELIKDFFKSRRQEKAKDSPAAP